MKTKQVIVMIRKFPHENGGTISLRMGKMVAQGSHASSHFAVYLLYKLSTASFWSRLKIGIAYIFGYKLGVTDEFLNWYENGHAKICVRVDSLEELMEINNTALSLGLPCAIIKDSGLTELGKPTITCLAIGPASVDEIDKVTSHLTLL